MGRWGSGLLDGDEALEYLGAAADYLVEHLRRETNRDAIVCLISLMAQFFPNAVEEVEEEILKKLDPLDRKGLPGPVAEFVERLRSGENRSARRVILEQHDTSQQRELQRVLGEAWVSGVGRTSPLVTGLATEEVVVPFEEWCIAELSRNLCDVLDESEADCFALLALLIAIRPDGNSAVPVEDFERRLTQLHDVTSPEDEQPKLVANVRKALGILAKTKVATTKTATTKTATKKQATRKEATRKKTAKKRAAKKKAAKKRAAKKKAAKKKAAKKRAAKKKDE